VRWFLIVYFNYIKEAVSQAVKHHKDKLLFVFMVFCLIKLTSLFATLKTLMDRFVRNCICLQLILNQDLQYFED
jgi:hypothetical protein